MKKIAILVLSIPIIVLLFSLCTSAVVYTSYNHDYRSLRTTGYNLQTPTSPFSYYMGSNGVYAGGSYPQYYVGSNRGASYHRMQVLTTRNNGVDSRYARYNNGLARQASYTPDYRVSRYNDHYGSWKAYWKPHQRYEW